MQDPGPDPRLALALAVRGDGHGPLHAFRVALGRAPRLGPVMSAVRAGPGPLPVASVGLGHAPWLVEPDPAVAVLLGLPDLATGLELARQGTDQVMATTLGLPGMPYPVVDACKVVTGTIAGPLRRPRHPLDVGIRDVIQFETTNLETIPGDIDHVLLPTTGPTGVTDNTVTGLHRTDVLDPVSVLYRSLPADRRLVDHQQVPRGHPQVLQVDLRRQRHHFRR